MRCETCGQLVSLPTFKKIVVDTLHKEYTCSLGHKNIVLRYGHCLEINGTLTYTNEAYSPTPRPTFEADRIRNVLQKTSAKEKN